MLTSIDGASLANNCYIDEKSPITLRFKYLNENKDSIDFVLTIDSIDLKNFRGIATLILIEDVDGKKMVPAGTNRLDYNDPNDIMGYKCDSTYSYISKDGTVNISFAMENHIKHFEYEKTPKHRLDFHFYKYDKDGSKVKISIDKTLVNTKYLSDKDL